MKALTVIFKALSDKNRFWVVAALMKFEELCACQIIELLKVKGATVSRHMGVLIDSDLIESRKEGRWVYYRLNLENKEINTLYKWVEKNLESEPDSDNFFHLLEKIASQAPEEICGSQAQ